MKRRTQAVVLSLLAAAASLWAAAPAAAHPLGNFTVNLFSAIDVSLSRVEIAYVVDMAEIATVQEMDALDLDGDGQASQAELDTYAETRAPILGRRLVVEAGGRRLAVEPVEAHAELLPGQAGLTTLRLEVTYRADLPSAAARLRYSDGNYPDRIGWREIVAVPSGGQGFAASSVPVESVSDRLTDYPKDLMSSPLTVIEAELELAPGAGVATAPEARAASGVPRDWAQGFTSLIERDGSPLLILGALLLAVVFGAMHALSPGHGKTIMAAYLLTGQGRARDALALGAAISGMHTLSVLVLGGLTLWASSLLPPERVYPYLSLVAGLVVLLLGGGLTWRRLLAPRLHGYRGGHQHHLGHDHHHHHGHDRGRGDASPLSRRGLVALALSGGLLPSPSALVVLLGGIALGRVAFGLVLVAAFSIGLAGALSALGLLVMRARTAVGAHSGRALSWLPVASAVVILGAGVVLTTSALRAL